MLKEIQNLQYYFMTAGHIKLNTLNIHTGLQQDPGVKPTGPHHPKHKRTGGVKVLHSQQAVQ